MKVITKTYPKDLDYLTLYPIGDIHFGAQECMEKEFLQYIKAIEADDHAAVVLLGDLINNGVKSSVTNCYEEKYSPHEQKIGTVDMLTPIKDKIICSVRGNHELRSAREVDLDIMYDISRMLQIEKTYAKDMGFLKVSLGNKYNNKPCTYSFCITHGAGGGQLLGSGANKPDSMQMTIEGIDGIISGHTHKPMKIPSARLQFDPRNNMVMHTKTLIFICTAWLAYGGYPEQKLLRPVAFNPDTIRLDGKVKAWK